MTLAMIHTPPQLTDFDPGFVVDVQRDRALIVLRVAGELDLCSAPRLAAELNAALAADQPAGKVMVDLAQVSFCDVRGLAALADANHQALRLHKRLVLVNPPRMLRRLLSITGLAEVLCVVGKA